MPSRLVEGDCTVGKPVFANALHQSQSLADLAGRRRVRNVIDHRSALTGGTQCCQSQRAAPAIW
jgi:hypothetical protein